MRIGVETVFYLTSRSSFGEFGLVWYLKGSQPKILRLTLPGNHQQLEATLALDYPHAIEEGQPDLVALAGDIRRYLDGEDLRFDLCFLDWGVCSDYQIRVLRAESGIPRGWISTYGRIASVLGVPGGSRAVGNALAANPFPLLVPCHRAVRSNGDLGGYQGGLKMKRDLLEMEGVVFCSPTKVSLNKVYY